MYYITSAAWKQITDFIALAAYNILILGGGGGDPSFTDYGHISCISLILLYICIISVCVCVCVCVHANLYIYLRVFLVCLFCCCFHDFTSSVLLKNKTNFLIIKQFLLEFLKNIN